MQLRNHPGMRWIQRRNWPPIWAGYTGPGGKFPSSEEGVLREVRYSKRHGLTPDHLALAVDYKGGTFHGGLGFDDPDPLFTQKVLKFLKRYIGRPMSEAGDAEVGSHFSK